MKIKSYIYTAIFIFALTLQVDAQIHRGKANWDKIRSEKISFITQKLELSPEEAQLFWPVYNKFEKEKTESHKKRRQLEREVRDDNGEHTDEEVIELTKQMVQTFQTEADLMKKYNAQFLDILPPQKVLQLYKTENEFRMHMLKQFRMRDKKN